MHRAYHPHHETKKRPIRWLAILAWAGMIYAATGFYTVQPNERAVVRRCGRLLDDVRGPGLHFGFPRPIDKVVRLKTRQSKRVAVRSNLADRALGRTGQPREAECLTGDRNLILVSAVVQYEIADPKAFLIAIDDIPSLVRDVVAGSLTSASSSMLVDDILTIRRAAIQTEVKADSQSVLDRYGTGVRITSVSLADGVGPPQEVAEAFSDVNSASADRQRKIEEAHAYAKSIIPPARGQAQRIVFEAEAYGEEVVQKARGETDRFNKMAEQLGNHRELTFKRLILETMEEVLPRVKKIILDPAAGETIDLGLIEANQ